MNLTRRNFLSAAGLSIAAAFTSQSDLLPAQQQQETASEWNWEAIRNQFDLTRDYIHLASFFIASHPRPVREAIEKYRREIDRNPLLTLEPALFDWDHSIPRKVKEVVSEYLNANPQEIALTGNTTTGLALVYQGLPLKAGQEILTTEHDHYSHHESIRLATQKVGATMRKILLFDSFDSITEDGIITRIKDAVKPNTRAVGITWVHSSSGLKLPIRKIADMLAELNRNREEKDRLLLIVDGVHGLGVENETVDSLGCDFLVAGTHKWMFAPRGTGIIWAKEATWALLQPTIPSFDSPDSYEAWMAGKPSAKRTMASWISPGGFHAYEHQWAMADAFRFHLQIGKKRVADRIHALNDQCKQGLSKIPGLKLYTPRSSTLSAGIICFDIEGNKPEQVVEKLLRKKIIASTTPYAVSYARLAPSLVNTPEEVETTVRELSQLRG